tara:strand:+ start:1075 stop:1626 length:552 start_codon:yes stop_codon:yes gene_type:complete
MLSYSSLTNTKLQIIKTSIILIISHLIRCNYGDFTCGNIYFLKNLLSLLCGFIFFNFIALRFFKKIFIKNKKIYRNFRNMLMYSCVIFSNYIIFDSIKINQVITIISIMGVYNIFSSIIESNNKINTHINFSYKNLVLNSINLNLFVILLDNFIFDDYNNLSKIKIISYSTSILTYLLVKNLI